MGVQHQASAVFIPEVINPDRLVLIYITEFSAAVVAACGTCITYGEEERCTVGFGGETEGKKPLGRPRSRWEYNTK